MDFIDFQLKICLKIHLKGIQRQKQRQGQRHRDTIESGNEFPDKNTFERDKKDRKRDKDRDIETQ